MLYVTKFNHMTDAEFLHEAYNMLHEGTDDFVMELYTRLSDVMDELDMYKSDYSNLDEETDRMRNEVNELAEELKRKVAA